MNITKHDRARLDKLKALADRGATEGERKAAREAMDRIMAKYGYRRKEKPKRKAPPKPAEPATAGAAVSFEELDEAMRQLGIDINAFLAQVSASSEEFMEALEKIASARDCGKL